MSNLPAYVPLSYPVKSYMNRKGIKSLSEYERFMQIIIEYMTELNIFNVMSFETVYFTLNEVGLYKMPPDMVDYVRIGIVYNGEIWEFTRNNNIAFGKNALCGIGRGNSAAMKNNLNPIWHTYSTPGGFNFGTYRVDKKRREIQFGGNIAGKELIMEYTSTGVSIDEENYIPRTLVRPLQTYLDWQLKVMNDEIPLSKEIRAGQLHQFELDRFKSLEVSFTLNEALDALRSGHKQTPKK